MAQNHSDLDSKSVLTQSFDLLEYLSAVAREIGPSPIRDSRRHERTIWPSGVPNHPAVRLGSALDRRSWMEVDRLPSPPTANVPITLQDLIENPDSLQSTHEEPKLSDSLVQRHVNARISDEFTGSDAEYEYEDEFAVEKFASELRDEILDQFQTWLVDTWAPWAASTRTVVAVRDLYSELYELHLRGDVDSATHEVIWGHLILSYSDSGQNVVAPLLTSRVTIELDPDSATIRVEPEQAVELELDALEGTGIPGLDGLADLQATVRNEPPDPWDPVERLKVRHQVLAPLGVDATLHDSAEVASPRPGPQLNDGWVLLLRKRPLRQERFYDELAHKILDEKFLPEALASVVADKDRVDNALMQLDREVTSNDGTSDRLLMPLPANDQQERIARQLASNRGVTVQGPPGTGKSHTIVNLVSHLVAQGKRVLVTAEKEQALSVLREKIPGELRDLSIAVLGSTPSAMEDLRSSAQSMQDSLSAIDVTVEEKRIKELSSTVDLAREELARIDAALVNALQSESREYPLPDGPARAPDVAKWLVQNRDIDIIPDAIPEDCPIPTTDDELHELVSLLQSVSTADGDAAIQELPDISELPSSRELLDLLERHEELRMEVTSLEDEGLRIEEIDDLTLESVRQYSGEARDAAQQVQKLQGMWEDQIAAATRSGDPMAAWVVARTADIKEKLERAQILTGELGGHDVDVLEGNPQIQLDLVQQWSDRLAAGKKVSWTSPRPLKDLNAQVNVDGYAVTTAHQLELVKAKIQLTRVLREAHTLMQQSYGPHGIPLPPFDDAFLFSALRTTGRLRSSPLEWCNG